jgi:hypothetical protein
VTPARYQHKEDGPQLAYKKMLLEKKLPPEKKLTAEKKTEKKLPLEKQNGALTSALGGSSGGGSTKSILKSKASLVLRDEAPEQKPSPKGTAAPPKRSCSGGTRGDQLKKKIKSEKSVKHEVRATPVTKHVITMPAAATTAASKKTAGGQKMCEVCNIVTANYGTLTDYQQTGMFKSRYWSHTFAD